MGLLEVGSRRLRSRSDRLRLVLEVNARRLGLEEVWSGLLVESGHEETDAVWALLGVLSEMLRLVGDLAHQALSRHGGPEHVSVVHALVAHVLRDDSRVADESARRHAQVTVDLEYLLLVRRQLGGLALQRRHHGILLARQTDGAGALLHRLDRILHLESGEEGGRRERRMAAAAAGQVRAPTHVTQGGGAEAAHSKRQLPLG